MPGGPEYNKPNQEWRAPPRPQPEQQANPLVPFLREGRGEGERSHEEMVAAIRKEMAAYVAERKPYQFDPTRNHLLLAENPERWADADRHEKPHAQLMMAWDLISQPYYKSAYHRERTAGAVQSDARYLGHTIMLTANESKLLSAMAEAVGIPNPFGQTPQEKKGGA